MATGKKAADIFTPTGTKSARPGGGLKIPPRTEGRPRSAETAAKTTVMLYERHVILLDKAATAVRERTGKAISRAELLRALVEKAAESLKPDAPGFDRTIDELLS